MHWGINLPSSIGIKNISKEERDMMKLPAFQFSVIIGIILSDACLKFSHRSINSNLTFKQSLSHSNYLWFIFSILSHYCTSYPSLVSGIRNGKKLLALQFFSRALPCLTELYSLFYPNGIKIIPCNIYELLTPIALAHMIMGDGVARPHGLQLCTDSYSI